MPRYYTVKLCIALQNPGFRAEGLEKTNFDVIFPSGIIHLLFDGLTYKTCDILLNARIFPRPLGARKNTTQLAKYLRVLYVKPSILG